MSSQIEQDKFTKQLFALLQESFEKVEGIYLDRGTSLFETLASLSAEEASRPITEQGTSIAGQVAHIHFYLEVLDRYMDGALNEKVDWSQSWLVKTVTRSEWDDLRRQIDEDYRRLRTHLNSFTEWNDDRRLGGALAIVAHTAYHLGAIRQILHLAKK